MSKKKIENQVEELVLPILEERAFDLVDVEFVKEGRNWYLRVYIDKPGGINIDDCEEVSIRLSEELDREDPIKHSYILEVSSPGLDRPLKRDKDFERYKGELVEVKLFKAIDGKKVFEGELLGLIDNRITIKQSNDQILSFNKEEVATTKRIIKF
ncbi:MAG TPA: ribosome maturation factor RimP [Clostridiaceae bacterium]|nr:ribosome maturation factor RimP [Clostridiaceae bacterium]